MADDRGGQTSILLPAARVMLFSRDEETVKAFSALAEDWRFARVVLDVQEGNVDSAAAFFEAHETPDLVIVQTENIDDGFSDRLEALAANCDEGTAAIVIGPVNDVDLYRKLVGMGVSDYLVRPLDSKALGDNIAATLIEKKGVGGSRLIAVMGSKGGVGASTIAQILARGLAEDFGQKTFLMDAAGGWSSLNVGLDFEPTTTLVEAARAAREGNEESLARMVVSPSEKLTVLGGGGDVMLDDSVDAEGYESLLDHVMMTYPFVVVDLSASPAYLKRLVLSRAQRVLMVTAPCLSAVRAVRTLLNEVKELRGGEDDASLLILNKKDLSPKAEVSKTQIEQGVEYKLSAIIPFLPDTFLAAEGAGQPLTTQKGGEEIVQALLALIGDLVGVKAGDGEPKKAGKGGVSALLDKIMTKT